MFPKVRDIAEVRCLSQKHMSLDSSSKNNLLETMDEDLLNLLKELRTLKNAGELDDEESLANQETLWRNRLEYNVFLSCLEHYDDEIRLEALAVLVESKKSTQRFSKQELDMIITFLTYNMRERLEYVPLIKKTLKRMKESLAVLRRHVAKEEKIRECENQIDTRYELYEKLREESVQVAQESQASIEFYKIFYQNLRKLCIQGIGPGSTHSHKRSSLQMLLLGQEFLDKEFEDLPWSKDEAGRLFECLLLDTYETNKEIIYKIAKGVEPRLFGLDDATKLREVIDVALDLGNCIRPIDSITASYMLKFSLLSPVIQEVLATYKIPRYPSVEIMEETTLLLITIVVERLKEPLKLAEENIVAAAGKHSLYGYLFCIRNLLNTCDLGKVMQRNHEAWIKTIAEIIEMSLRLNHVVSQIVNNSSPEGHLPMDMESSSLSLVLPESDVTLVTPQMVLLCSWRTVKEVSLLFGHLSAKSPIIGEKTVVGLLNEKQLVDIGEHLVTLLFETKHRGAFEQAHVGFGQLCTRLWRLNQESLKKLPKVWLHHLLLAVSGLSPGNAKLCATRRSAGVPFMVQALVSSDPFVQSKPSAAVFHSVMRILLGFTELEEGVEIPLITKTLMYEDTIFSDFQDSDNAKNYDNCDSSSNKRNHEIITEIKTHALNILRALFKHAQLGDLSKTYAADGLKAAIRSYDGKTWAERNAATLLFSSLITRIFGVQRTKDHVNLTLHNKMTGRIFFERYPTLLPFMLNELQAFVNASDTLIKPSVQSILLLLSRLYPSFNSDDADSTWKIDDFIKLVSACAKSKVYKTRELAARALVPLLTEKTVHTFIVELFEKIAPGRSNDLSFNALHGYMLQIVEIIRSPQFTMKELPQKHIDSFLGGSHWIIENVESNNHRSACFPLATSYVTAFRKFIEAGSNISELKRLFNRLVLHLNFPQILKQRPGREIYEFAVAKMFVTVMEHQAFAQKNRNDTSESIVIAWSSILSHDNVQVKIAGWSGVANIVKKTCDKKLMNVSIAAALKSVKQMTDPDLQESVFEFLYSVLAESNEDLGSFGLDNLSVNSLGIYVITNLVTQMQTSCFQESPSFIRLLGKAYGKLTPMCKDDFLTPDFKRSVYKTFLDNSWMGTSDTGCRIAISNVIYDVFVESPKSSDDRYISLDWWTSLLNLLVDDNAEVRREASLVVCRIKSPSQLSCANNMVITFFDKFMECTVDEPSFAFAALFVWNMALSGDGDYEMDESDVFNKCYNYEIFEPLRISELCANKLKDMLQYYSFDEELPLEVRYWLAERLSAIDSTEFASARDLLAHYGKTVPVIDDKLGAIIDPTHNDKLLQALAYKRFSEHSTNAVGCR